MVLTKTGAAQTVSIAMLDWEIQIDLPADSIATLTWSNEIRGEK